eukprot:m.207206 g.207206  ORF g.207206 m.207206 type:complete len:106 (+) comp26072_c0_seq29:1395-1712(+)
MEYLLLRKASGAVKITQPHENDGLHQQAATDQNSHDSHKHTQTHQHTEWISFLGFGVCARTRSKKLSRRVRTKLSPPVRDVVRMNNPRTTMDYAFARAVAIASGC